jgi:putative transcriptional regulator
MRNNLKLARARRGITQAELAAAVAVSRQTIVAIERGNYVPSALLALKMAQYFAQPVEALFELEASD